MMSRAARTIAFAALALVLFAVASPAFGQSVDQIADAIEESGYFISDGVEPLTLDALAGENPSFGYVALASDPVGGARSLAVDILERTSKSTVIVVTATEIGVQSFEFDDARVERALDYSDATSGASYFDEFEQITTGLIADVSTPGTQQIDPSEHTPISGISGWVLLGGFVVVVGSIAFINMRNERRAESLATGRIVSAREEIRGQMAVIANEILEFADRVGAEDHPEAIEHFRSASQTYDQADEMLVDAATQVDLEELSDALDIARWELAAAEAIVTGEVVPPRPSEDVPQACFFDPRHGAGVRQAELKTPAGTGSVWVCRADYDKLASGETPQPRQIDVDGTAVAAPQAPRDHGGGGFDWLDAFSIIVGGMGNDYRWRRPPGRTRAPAGGNFGLPFPGGFGGGRSSSGGGSRRRVRGGGSALRSGGRSAARSGGGSRKR